VPKRSSHNFLRVLKRKVDITTLPVPDRAAAECRVR
jgi:hypothetical protein